MSSCGPTDLLVVGETGDLIQRRVFCCVDLGQVLAVLSCCVLRRTVLSSGIVD